MAIGFTRTGIELGAIGVDVIQESYSATIELPRKRQSSLIDKLEQSGFKVTHEIENIYTITYKNVP